MRAACRPGRHLAALIAAGTAAIAVVAIAGAPAAHASRTQWSIFEDHPYLVRTDAAKREAILDEIKALGADTLRIEVKWNEVAPDPDARKRPTFDATNPAAYPGFGPYDGLITSALARKFRILVTITGDAPRWATSRARGGNYQPDAAEYAKFAAAVGKRYSGVFSGLPKIVLYSIWNEPNHINFIKPTSQAPRIYRRLVEAGVPALRQNAAREAKILVGELKPTPAKGLGPKKFLRQWLCLDSSFRKLRGAKARRAGCTGFKKIDADGFAHHPYGPTELRPKKQDIINMNVIRRLGTLLDKAANAGRLPRKLRIYNTEFGLQTNPPDVFVATSPTRQAALVNEKEEFSYRYARLKSYSQYQLYDDPSRPGPPAVKWAGFQTGLRFANGRKKPSYDAYRFPIVVRKVRGGVSIWGRVRPGSGVRLVQLERQRGSRFVKAAARIRTNSSGYFTRKASPGKYRFQAYSEGGGGPASGSAVTLLGTSRTASPKALPTR